jgi:hypothetical protein
MIMAYSIGLLRAAHKSATVHVVVRQGADTYAGTIVGIGSKLGILSDGELIEDVPVEHVIWADVRAYAGTELLPHRIGRDYARAIRDAVPCTLDGPFPDTRGDVPGGFSLLALFANGYGVHIARNGLSYGGEIIALFIGKRLVREGLVREGQVPEGTDIPPWNDLRLGGPEDAARIAVQVASLPAV